MPVVFFEHFSCVYSYLTVIENLYTPVNYICMYKSKLFNQWQDLLLHLYIMANSMVARLMGKGSPIFQDLKQVKPQG